MHPGQLKRFKEIIASYEGKLPLHHYLKSVFRNHREMGSRDRKIATQVIYSFFRLGRALADLESEERMAVAVFLTGMQADQVSNYLVQTFSLVDVSLIGSHIDEKLNHVASVYPAFNLHDLFPFDDVSTGIDKMRFCKSMLVQPALWIRASDSPILNERKGTDHLCLVLKEKGIDFYREEGRLMLQAGVDLEAAGIDHTLYEVQDRSSQLTGKYFRPQNHEHWFDCCAASGGKSLLLHAINPTVQLTVNDVRAASLKNLQERFNRNKISGYNIINADMTIAAPQQFHNKIFDGIIADVPCSGSGTWSRTPEQLSFFNQKELEKYVLLQRKIIENCASLLAPGKPLIYITCSVFRQENEEQTEHFCSELGFTLEEQTVIPGYDHRADSMFVARLIKSPEGDASRTA